MPQRGLNFITPYDLMQHEAMNILLVMIPNESLLTLSTLAATLLVYTRKGVSKVVYSPTTDRRRWGLFRKQYLGRSRVS